MKDAYEQMSKLDLNLALAAHTQGGREGPCKQILRQLRNMRS